MEIIKLLSRARNQEATLLSGGQFAGLEQLFHCPKCRTAHGICWRSGRQMRKRVADVEEPLITYATLVGLVVMPVMLGKHVVANGRRGLVQ